MGQATVEMWLLALVAAGSGEASIVAALGVVESRGV
jgi:hypothetical protein